MDDSASSARESAEAFDRLELSARQAGRSMQAAFAAASTEGLRLEDALRAVGSRLAEMALQTAGRAASGLLAGGLSQALTGLASGSIGGGLPAGGGDAPSSVAQSGGSAGAVSVFMTVSTPDADSFRQSEAQVSAALARAVSRGSRAM
jgi:hypothetical protein